MFWDYINSCSSSNLNLFFYLYHYGLMESSFTSALQSVTIIICFDAHFVPNRAIGSLFKQVSVSFWHVRHQSLSMSMFSGTRCFRVIMCLTCPSLGISHFLKEESSLETKMWCSACSLLFRFCTSWATNLRNIWIYIDVDKYKHFTCILSCVCIIHIVCIYWIHTDKSEVHADPSIFNPAPQDSF